LKDGIARIIREELGKLRNEMRTMVMTDNNGAVEVLDEVCKDDVEVEGNQSVDSKEDAENKKCWLISNDIVKGGKG
nr:wall-associated kinase family protein [Tanacetum cinerariifolium]